LGHARIVTSALPPAKAPAAAAMVLVTFIFGGQFVAAKYLSVQGVPTADLVAMRYLPAGLVLLPFVLFYRPWRERTAGRTHPGEAPVPPIRCTPSSGRQRYPVSPSRSSCCSRRSREPAGRILSES